MNFGLLRQRPLSWRLHNQSHQPTSRGGEGRAEEGRGEGGRDVVSQPLGATTGINPQCDRSRTAWSAAVHHQAPRRRTPDPSSAGGKAFSSPIFAERHGNQ